jgi:hypothetical protein
VVSVTGFGAGAGSGSDVGTDSGPGDGEGMVSGSGSEASARDSLDVGIDSDPVDGVGVGFDVIDDGVVSCVGAGDGDNMGIAGLLHPEIRVPIIRIISIINLFFIFSPYVY